MAETLDENLNIISENETIEIELLDGDLNIIQKLDDEPNDVGGLTAAQLKEQFDKSGNIIKEYINNKLVPAVLAADATESARTAAEAARADGETGRVNAENARVLAEQERVQAENRRSVWAQYTASAAYEPGNKVSRNGSSYVNIKACTGVAPDASGGEEYWLLIAQKGDRGEQGEKGEQGEQGDPFAYEDFTQEQLDDLAARATGLDRDSIIEDVIANIDAPVSDYLSEELAKRSQLTPEYADSLAQLEESGDPNKLYVLPDGYIYAYMTKYGAQHTNLIPTAIDSDGTPYNDGLGFIRDWKLSSAGDLIQNEFSPGFLTTGFIPYNPSTTKVLRICGWSADPETAMDHVTFYDASFTNLGVPSVSVWADAYGQTFEKETAFNEDVYTVTFDLDTFTVASPWYGGEIKSKAAYIRVSIRYPVVNCAVVTFDEEISFTASSKWQSTGHQFVPADCEERIIPLEETAEDHEERIHTLELYGADSTSAEDIPAYIKTEADDVMSRLIERQGNRCFTMIGISDFHYGGVGDNKDNLIRACKAISYIQGRIHVDAVATLGDNLPFGAGGGENMAKAHRWSKEINEILKMTEGEGVAMFRTPGNHDRLGGLDEDGNETSFMPDDDMYRYIGGYNRGCVMDVPGGWGYQDFETYKLRVILLNTAETEGVGRFSEFSGYHMSGKQYRWLIDTLDMSDRADARDWQILVLSHHRPDDYQVGVVDNEWGVDRFVLPNILHAYRTGGSYTAALMEDNTVVSCDFAGKNQAGLIGVIYGHHHAYIYGNLKLGNNADDTESEVMAICTPTSSFGSGEGHNDDNEGNWYTCVKDTAEETAFCIYSIDLDNHVIHAIHYGNGLDREISYTIPDNRAGNIPETETLTFEMEDGSTMELRVVVR